MTDDDLIIDEVRYARDAGRTGIYVRAYHRTLGRWLTEDIAMLEAPSLLRWVRSRDADHNGVLWRDNTIACLLGHGSFEGVRLGNHLVLEPPTRELVAEVSEVHRELRHWMAQFAGPHTVIRDASGRRIVESEGIDLLRQQLERLEFALDQHTDAGYTP